MEESRGKWNKVRNEELNDLHSSTNIIPVIKSRLRWVGHVAGKRCIRALGGYN